MTFSTELGRRQALRLGALTALAMPLAACATGYDDSPDPLEPLLRAARADAKAAEALASSGGDARVAKAVAKVRREQALALGKEVRRANRPAPSAAPVSGTVKDLGALGKRLASARKQASALVSSESRYRAGLLGSVAAGCAAAQSLSGGLGAVRIPEAREISLGAELEEDTVASLREALDAEHAAIWAYGLVSAFLPGEYDVALADGGEEHRERRDALRLVITEAGATPNPAEPAYVPAGPVSDAAQAQALLITAESDGMASWRGVVQRTDDARLRQFGLDALVGAAVRGTRWRAEAGITPSAFALPGLAG